MQIGTIIEDAGVKDLKDYLNVTTHPDLIAVFKHLQCESRNHLRSFITGIENGGTIYISQFLTQAEFNSIISCNLEECN